MIADHPIPDRQEALKLAEVLGLTRCGRMLITIGGGRINDADAQGARDIRGGLQIVLAGNYLGAAIRGYTNLTVAAHLWMAPTPTLRLAREAEAVAARFGTKARSAGLAR
jgi:hypothetical protein